MNRSSRFTHFHLKDKIFLMGIRNRLPYVINNSNDMIYQCVMGMLTRILEKPARDNFLPTKFTVSE